MVDVSVLKHNLDRRDSHFFFSFVTKGEETKPEAKFLIRPNFFQSMPMIAAVLHAMILNTLSMPKVVYQSQICLSIQPLTEPSQIISARTQPIPKVMK